MTAPAPATPPPKAGPDAGDGDCFSYVPLSPYTLSVPAAARESIGFHSYLVSGNSFDLQKLQTSWYRLVDAWPVLAASIVCAYSTPSPVGGGGADKLGSDAWILKIPSGRQLKRLAAAKRAPTIIEARDTAGTSPTTAAPSPSFTISSAPPGTLISTIFPGRLSGELSASSISTLPSLTQSELHKYAPNAPNDVSNDLLIKSSASDTVSKKHSLVSVHVTLFNDGLLAVLTAPTIFLDPDDTSAYSAFALEDIVNEALTLTLTQRSILPTPYGWFTYPFFARLYYSIRETWNNSIRFPLSSFEARDVFVPTSIVESLMGQAKADLKAEGHNVDGEEGRVEKEHVLLAWMLQLANKGKDRDSTLLSVLVPANLRKLKGPKGNAYVPSPYLAGNSALPTVPLSQIPYPTILASRLGVLALRIRYALESQEKCASTIIQWQVANHAPILGSKAKTNTHYFPPTGDAWTFSADWVVGGAGNSSAGSETGAGIDFSFALGDAKANAGVATSIPLPDAGADKSATVTTVTAKNGALLHSSSHVFFASKKAKGNTLGGRKRWTLALPRALPDGTGYWSAAVLPSKSVWQNAMGFGAATSSGK
ncbi:hypothetical protein K437DRAFT_275888 [Tilletiaria anomala UBC 951]|uniref:Uncharacterized protein n=1 Tax=Tilletiaria anomala (strain ATCC 24038 / CBS 436.72 / UBC 951) TaxID=1037660 RepID=A0A066VEI4_TILAU|nr:uncharacterized protein K437DRAFT_275888 [Tilletiaria anomala UBC 951]KDN39831.1 hypothetical protein K437DRAFT_275888 [Tilletiaria anomala UBC 951]